MKKRTIIVLLVAFAVLIGIYAVVANWTAISERFFPEELKPYEGDGTSIIYTVTGQSQISRIDWTLEGIDYSVVRGENNEFYCEEDVLFDQEKIKTELLDNLYTVKASHELKDVDLADYGLDEPWMHFTVYGSPEEGVELKVGEEPPHYTVYIGTYNPVTETHYATMDFETVYLLYNKIPTRFGSYEMYAVSTKAPENGTLVSLTIGLDGEEYEYKAAVDGDGTFYSTVFSWYIKNEDGKPQPVNVDAIDALYQIYYDLSWSDIVAREPEDLSEFGLDGDPLSVEFEYTYPVQVSKEDGSNVVEQRTGVFKLYVGAPADENRYYVMQDGSDSIRTMSAEKLSALLSFDPDAVTYHVAVVPEWQTLRGMDITLADGTKCSMEIRVDDNGVSTYFIEGKEVEKEDVRSVFVTLFNPAIDGFATAERNRADAEIVVHFDRARSTFSDMTLYLIPYNSSMYVIDFNDEQRYLVSARLINDITAAVQEALELVR